MDELCKTCQHHEWSHTVMLGGCLIKEDYCGATNTEEFCGGEYYLEDGE